MHRSHHPQLAAAGVAQFPLHEAVGNDAKHLTAALEHGIRDDTHQADVATAVNKPPATTDDLLSEKLRSFRIRRVFAVSRAAEDAEGGHENSVVTAGPRRTLS